MLKVAEDMLNKNLVQCEQFSVEIQKLLAKKKITKCSHLIDKSEKKYKQIEELHKKFTQLLDYVKYTDSFRILSRLSR